MKRPAEAVRLSRRQILRVAAAAAASPVTMRVARAQAYPTRPITMVVPYPAGGATDTLARILSERMKVSLGQPIVIEDVGNRYDVCGPRRRRQVRRRSLGSNRDRGARSTEGGQVERTMGCEPELVTDRPCDLPGCAASADP